MAHQSTRPMLMTKVRQNKYGRHDYERFDHLASSHRSAGRGKIGKVEVDCRFIFTKSQWGYLGAGNGHPKIPAGIVYLDLVFRQPSTCRLQSATVEITLEEDEAEGQVAKRDTSSCPVKFTIHYGPRDIRGRQRSMQTTQVKSFIPEIHVGGTGGGGVGVRSEKTTETASRWNFSGHLSSSDGSQWDNVLKWDMEENFLEAESMHSNVIHTAFAFEHNAKAFYMTVEVKGKLARVKDRLKNKLKFGGSQKKEQETVTTKFEWKKGYSCPMWLDKMARDLPYDMEYANMANVPVEIPDPSPVEFHPSTTGQERSGRSWLKAEQQHQQQEELDGDKPLQRISEPTIEEMSIAAGFISAPPPATSSRRRDPPYQSSESSDETTLVDQDTNFGRDGAPGGSAKDEDAVTKQETRTEDQKSKEMVPDELEMISMLEWVRRMNMIILSFFVSLLGIIPLDMQSERRAMLVQEDSEEAKDTTERERIEAPSRREKLLLKQDESDGESLPPELKTPAMRRMEELRRELQMMEDACAQGSFVTARN